MNFLIRFSILLTSFSLAKLALADASVEQTWTLQPGWNAIHFEIDPNDGDPQTSDDRAPAKVFSLPEISMVWAHPYASTTAQYLQSPSEAGFNEEGWKLFVPDKGEEVSQAFLTNLYAVTPAQVYLVKVDGDQSVELSVRGKPFYRPIKWIPQQFNLVGFYVDPDEPVSFANMLGLSATQTPSIFALDENSQWELVDQGKHALVESGKGYWIYNDSSINQSGPLDISPNLHGGLFFQAENLINHVSFSNRSKTEGPISFSLDDDFPLQYFAGYSEDGVSPQWEPIAELAPQVSTGSQFRKMVSVDPEFLAEEGNESVLTIRGAGMRVRLPIGAVPALGREGLWAGIAVLNAVTNVHSENQEIEQTPAPLQMKLLLHVDANNQARLLKQVYVMGRAVPTEDSEGQTTEAVLVANDACLASFHPLNLTNREGAGHRLSTSAFDFSSITLPLNGSVEDDAPLTATLSMNADLATHPMKHRYHVNHDDKDNSSGDDILGDADTSPFYDEVWDITRNLSLTPDTRISPSPDAGMGQITGVYAETITGIHKTPITLQGRFLLQRISRETTLVEEDCLL